MRRPMGKAGAGSSVASRWVAHTMEQVERQLPDWMTGRGGAVASGVAGGALMVMSLMLPFRMLLPTVVVVPLAFFFMPIAIKDSDSVPFAKSRPSRGWLWKDAPRGGEEGDGEGAGGREDPSITPLRSGESRDDTADLNVGDAVAAELRGLMDLVMRDIIQQWYQTMISEDDR